MIQNELYHYGVKGMKWGVRKTPVRSPSKSKKSKSGLFNLKLRKSKTKAASSKKSTSESTKSISEMTDDELRRAINRMQMEKQYKDLSPKQISKGKAFTKRVMNNIVIPAAEDVAKQLVKSGMTKATNRMLDALDLEEEYKIYTNNKKK